MLEVQGATIGVQFSETCDSISLPVLIAIWKYLSNSRLFQTQYIELKEQPSASLIWPRMQQHCIPDCICWHFQCNSMSAFFMISSLASVLLAWGLRMTSQNIQINFCRLPYYTHLHLELGDISKKENNLQSNEQLQIFKHFITSLKSGSLQTSLIGS